MTVTLREIDRENFRRCVKLEVHEAQRGFVKTGEVAHGEEVMRLSFEG